MQFQDINSFKPGCNANHGFSLMEVIVVMVIVAILATGVVFMFANPSARVKAEAFQMLGNFNLARAEAVRRNQNILVQFYDTAKETCGKDTQAHFNDCFGGGSYHGYVICFNEDLDGVIDDDCSDEAATTAELEEKIITALIFKEFVKYYAIGAVPPTDGPANAPNGNALTANNGITFTAGNYFSMAANGTSSDTGAIVIFYPEGTAIRGKPYGLVVTNIGNIQLFRWRPEVTDDGVTPQDERWSRK